MTTQLYTVTMTREVIVAADSPDQAIEYTKDEMPFTRDDEAEYRTQPMAHLPMDWDLDSMPLGLHEDDKTVGDWINEGAAPEYAATQARIKAAVERIKAKGK